MSVLTEAATQLVGYAHEDPYTQLPRHFHDELIFEVIESPELLYRLYLKAATNVHPFFLGGDTEAFDALRRAKRALDAHQRAMRLLVTAQQLPMQRA